MYYIFEDENGYNIFYKDITDEWLSQATKNTKEIKNAKYVIKNGKSRNAFYHALEKKNKQSEIFLIDCTDATLTDKEILDRINIVFISTKNDYIKAIIIKNNNKIFGVFKKGE